MRALAAVTVLALTCAAGARAHEGDSHAGFVATVSGIEPPVLGLLVTVVGGHERLSVRNWTRKTIVVYGEDGRDTLRLAPGDAGAIADPRIGSSGPPPAEGEFVKNWRIPGAADGERFEIVGFLGYRPPADAEEEDSGLSAWAMALTVGGGILLTATLALLLLARREGESAAESSEPTGSA